MRRAGLVGPLTAAALLGPSATPAPAQDLPLTEEAARRLSPSLRAALPGLPAGERLPVIVQFRAVEAAPPPVGEADAVPALQRRAALSLAPLDALAPAGDPELEVTERLWVVPAALAEASPAGIVRLAETAGVERVWRDEPLEVVLPPSVSLFAEPAFVSDALRQIGADAVWAGGATGRGVTVAIFDTGVDGANRMLASRWRGRNGDLRAAWFDPFRRASGPQDLNGHGTQVAVAAVGALPAGDTLRLPDGGVLVATSGLDVVAGPAPEAEWIAARVFDALGGGVFTRRSVLLQAFQWALDPDGSPATDDAPDVINNSWGIFPGTADFDPCEDLIYDAIDAAEAAGVAVLFASGNTGPDPGSVAAPAARDDPQLRSFGVGATRGADATLEVAPFSGRGPSPCAGGIKPEIVSPGTVPQVVAAGPGSARLTGFAVGGTSFSVAQASGALAVLRQRRPADPARVLKQALMDGARDIGPPGPDNDAGHGILDVPGALAAAGASIRAPHLQLAGAWVDEGRMALRLRNRGDGDWPGGEVRLAVRETGEAGSGPVPSLDAGGSVLVSLPLGSGPGTRTVELEVRDATGATSLLRLVRVAPPNVFGGFVLASGELAVGANDFGRIGQVAGQEGLVWRGEELLPAAGIGIAAGGRLSDAFYVTVLGRPDQKTRPPAIDTDWAPQRAATDVGAAATDLRFDDFDALVPLGVEVTARLEAVAAAGAGGLAITARVRNRSATALADVRPALLADFDLAGGEAVRFSPRLEALVFEARGGAGPIAVLAGDTGPEAGSVADLPLGTPGAGGFYEPGSGLLVDEFAEETRRALVEGASTANLPGAATATDRAGLVTAAARPLAAGQESAFRFWLLAADDEDAAAALLAELRAATPQPPPGPGDGFAVRPPFPNPLRIGEGEIRFPVDVPDAARTGGARLSLEIYDLAGRRLFRRTETLSAAGALPVFAWDGRLADGSPAAGGVYLYVVELDDARRTGRLMLVR
ncbi:MAG: S8 family serine peptidase [Gemmatimonadota bacterium]|nr:S8 family serine peptidase [Gemmatimonadota bacterium]